MSNLREMLRESSLSDGTPLYLVLNKLTDAATLEDVLVEIGDEMHLFNIIRGARYDDLKHYRLFNKKAKAEALAKYRLQEQEPLNTP